MTVKPSWKKLETYLVVVLIGYGMDLVQKILTAKPGDLGLPPQYSAVVAAVLAIACPMLLAFFAKLRHDAYASAGEVDPTETAPAPAPDPGAPWKPAKGFASVRLLLVLAIAGVAFLASSCKTLTPTETKLIQCGQTAIANQLPNLVPQATAALASGGMDWAPALDSLLVAGGEAAVCAVEVAVAALEQQATLGTTTAAASSAPPLSVQISRGHAWLQGCEWHRSYRASVAIWAP